MTYTYQVNFDKTFISGLLKGHRYNGTSLRFTSLADARAFVASAGNGKVLTALDGAGGYTCDEFLISTLE